MKTISRIAYSNDKRNRTRSILIMMAICLTTMLLVIISTVGNGVIRLQKSQAASSYGSNYGLFIAADGSQLKEVNRRAEIDATGTMCTEGIIKGNEKGGFVCMDETARKMLPYNKEYELKEGKYPEKMQEIAAGKAFFRAMGYDDVKIGDTVTLDYRAGMQSEYKSEEFVISGILYDRDEYTIEASYVAFGSQEFYDEHVAENDRQYNIYFTLNDSANVSMNVSMNDIDSVIKQIAATCGIEEKNVIVNDLYLQWVLQPSYETIAVCGVLILAIVLFSVVVIYNIFQVGIANKIQEYGKIKALGATKKQMKQLIFREGMFLTISSIPVGLLLGFLIAKCGFNWLVKQGNLVSTGTQYNIYFTLSDSANVSMNNVAPVIKEIADSCGIDQKNVIINDLYLQWVLQPSYEMIVVCGTLILGIVLFSVVVIYNIFQVGIAQKVQEYGKIKALGATRKQMKQLIFREGILLAVPSIPLGLLFGFLIAKVSFNWLVEQGNLVSSGIKNHQVPLFSLTIMLICIFVSFLTVVLALRKPMKIVSRISPIEATRYLDGSKTQKQGRRKGRKDVTVFSMAMANVTGNPKRTIATIFTMGLSCVLFVIISNYVGNIDTEHEARIAINHGQFELQLDYSQNYDEAYSENNLDTILQNNPLNDSLIKEIKSIPGVTDVLTREIVSADLNGTKFPVAIVNQEDFEMMRGDGDIGSMDYAQAVKNGDVFFGWSMWMEADGYSAGAPITFNFDNGSGTYTYHGKIAGSFVSADTYLVIPEEVYRSVNPKGTSYGYLWVDCAKKDVASVEQSLNDLLSDTSHIKLNTYHAELQTAEYASRMMKLGCYLFMAIVGLIGFMNLANTMIINITTKKQEYGVLQAVGMTNKQLNLCLQIQGLIFTVGTICVALAAGLPLGYALFSYAKHNGIFGMNVYHVPLIPILVMILLVGILQIVLSCVLSSNLKKETLVERIRYQG